MATDNRGIFDARGSARRPIAAFAVFAAALGSYLLWAEGFDVFRAVGFQLQRRDAANPLLRAGVTAALYIVGVVGLAAVARHRIAGVRFAAWLLIALTTATSVGWSGVDDTGFTVHAATLIWTESDYMGEALGFFFGRYAAGAALALAITGALWWGANRWVPRVRPLWVCVVPIAVLLSSALLLRATFAKVDEFPTPYRVPVLIEYARSHRQPYYGERQAPEFRASGVPVADHIVFIVDESVSGDLLGLNGGPAETTPFLSGLGSELFNFGVIPAISNRSSTTNIVLQSGLRPDQLPDEEARSLKQASVFAYMSDAGFETFYVDVQTYGPPSNYLTRFDVDALDGFVQIIPEYPGIEEYELDLRAAEQVVEHVRASPRSFQYVLKSGAHIHYEGRYPDSARFFQPTLEKGELGELNFEGADRERTLNSYLNALRWTVDTFWRELLTGLEGTGKSILVVYTSDHGQSLLEMDEQTGQPETLSHNRVSNPPVYQAVVPLFVWAAEGPARAWLERGYQPSLRGRVDQFALFPTLLVAAGYAPETVADRFGGTLFDRQEGALSRRFASGNLFDPSSFRWNDFEPTPRPVESSNAD